MQWVKVGRGVAVYRESEAGTWLIDDSRGGKRKRMSSKSTRLSVATAQAEKLFFPVEVKSIEQIDPAQQYFELDALRRQVAATTPAAILERLSKIEQAITPEAKKVEKVSIPQAIEALLRKIKGRSNAARYQRDVRSCLERFARESKVSTVDEIKPEHVDEHLLYLKSPKPAGAGCSPKTRKNLIGVVREFATFCHGRGWIPTNPAKDVMVRAPKPEIRFYTATEVRTVVETAEREGNEFLATAFLSLIYMGVRLDSLHKLRWDQILFERRQVRVWAKKVGRWETIPLFDQILKPLQKLKLQSQGETVFAEGRKAQALGRAVLRLVARALPGRKKVEYEAGGNRGDGSQTCRRTWVTHLRASGVSERTVSKWAIHGGIVDRESYSAALPDGERALPFTFLGKKLIAEGIPCEYPEPGRTQAK